jgi:hypothetical protein
VGAKIIMDRLAVIIAEMIRSALAWEREHGMPERDNRKIEPKKPLTSVPLPYTVEIYKNADRGDVDEHKNNDS